MMIARTLSIFIGTLLLATCSIPTRLNIPTIAITDHPKYKLLLILIDGLRADALEHGQAPQLARLASDGVHARWMTPSYPALTLPNAYTLITGLRPDHHGIVHNTMEDPLLGHSNRNVRKQSATDAGGEANPYGSVLSTPAYAALHFSGQVAKHQSPVRDQAAGMPITNTFQQIHRSLRRCAGSMNVAPMHHAW